MSKLDALRAGLSRTLDKANRSEAKHKAKPPTLPIVGGKCEKLSISLSTADVAKLQNIQAHLALKGEMVTRSTACKLAIRSAQISDKLLDLLSEVKAEDGRKWK